MPRVYLPIGHTENPFDIRWKDIHSVPAMDALPDSVSLGSWLGPVKNQGQEGSCSAQSGCGVMELLTAKQEGQRVTLSPAMLYQVERVLQGTPDQDAGARLRVTQYALQTVGVCQEALDPYTPADFLIRLNPQILQDASRHRIAHGYWAPSLPEILGALAFGLPVQIGIVVTQSFESPEVAATGKIPLPPAGDPVLGGHAMVAYGFVRSREVVLVRNSWGQGWGRQGNCEIPFAYFQNPDLFISARIYTLK